MSKYCNHCVVKEVFIKLVSLSAILFVSSYVSKSYAESVSISELYVASGQGYDVISGMFPSEKVYIDENYTFTDVKKLTHLKYIRTANSDKGNQGVFPFLSFTVDQNVSVYVLFDKNSEKRPSWLEPYKKMKYTIKADGVRYSVFRKNFSKGRVELGANEKSAKGQKMYLVAVAPSSSEYVSTPEPVVTPLPTGAPVPSQPGQSLDRWDYSENNCFSDLGGCFIDFSRVNSIDEFEDWVIAFRTGGSKNDDNNEGFSLNTINSEQALIATQANTRDPGGSRRTEAKVAHMPVGDYKITFDVYISELPDSFDATISQIKCGSGKPPINVKLLAGGGLKVRSAGETIFKDSATIFNEGWNRVIYTLEDSNKEITVEVNGEVMDVDNRGVETDCNNIQDAGRQYYLKIGLYEDGVEPGFSVAYRNLRLEAM